MSKSKWPHTSDMRNLSHSVIAFPVSGKRYALTLQLMLKRSRKRKPGTSRSPNGSREPQRSLSMVIDHHPNNAHQPAMMPPPQHPRSSEPFSPTYEMSFANNNHNQHHLQPVAPQPVRQGHPAPEGAADAESIWQGFELTSQEQLPVWISDQSLGGHTFSQHGMDAFLLPSDYLPPAPQIW